MSDDGIYVVERDLDLIYIATTPDSFERPFIFLVWCHQASLRCPRPRNLAGVEAEFTPYGRSYK
jgi:hypothetical protein